MGKVFVRDDSAAFLMIVVRCSGIRAELGGGGGRRVFVRVLWAWDWREDIINAFSSSSPGRLVLSLSGIFFFELVLAARLENSPGFEMFSHLAFSRLRSACGIKRVGLDLAWWRS